MCEHGMETFMKNIQILFQLRKAIEVCYLIVFMNKFSFQTYHTILDFNSHFHF